MVDKDIDEKDIDEIEEPKIIPAKLEKPKFDFNKLSYAKIGLLVFGIVIGIAVGFGISYFSGATGMAGASASKEDVKANLISYVDSIRGEGSTSISSIITEDGLYKIKMEIEGQVFDVYTTLSGKLMFPQAVDLSLKPQTAKPVELPKADKPEVQLFVMSQCPYGVQAETAIQEVVKLLGNKISFAVEYIATDKGDGTFDSLHGPKEVAEDTRQLCINKYFASKFWNYLACVSKDYQNVDKIWENCANQNEITLDKIKTCSTGKEGSDLLAASAKESDANQVRGSPTLIINGVTYQGGRTADAFKTAICSAFNTAPDACGETLSSNTTPASGSC